jgi:hypothetical protein
MHRHNATDSAIQTFKNHLIAGICSVDPLFPMKLWDKCLPEATTSLNMLRKSRINPHMSAHDQLEGHYDFNRVSISPPGTRMIAHEKPKQQATWDAHGQDGYYIGPAPEHNRCYKVHINETHVV